MDSLSRIVLPVDFSERSAAAARYARTLVARFGSQLILLHVLMPPQYESGEPDISGSMLAELYRSQAGHASCDMESLIAAELPGLEVRRAVLEGDPARRIVEFAQTERADLILMPTHGYGPFRRFILGSNTAKVLHDADCPVWTGVHRENVPAAAPASFGSILCAVDLGSQSSKTLCWAALLAREFGARLTLLHAATCSAERGGNADRDWWTEVREAAEKELARLQEFVRVEADRVIEAGEPAKVICAAAARLHADVLVIGRGSAAGVFGRLRTNAYAIIRESPCPVVSV